MTDAIRLGDLVGLDASGDACALGIVAGWCSRGWIVELEDGGCAVTFAVYKAVAA